ncbi:MAG: hypothetical protein AUH79_01505 [Betaproteobacteria bacterium 13_1_40CM_4_64_4]|nr:MAG: hypothetical protein AUH79_01505 [Betaproteobacteria bacterium 13_1_40CM_4_64_4]
MPDHSLLDLQRRVLGDRKIGEHRRGDRRSARLAQQQSGLRIRVDEHFLDGDLGGMVFDDDAADIAQNDPEPLRQLTAGVADAAARDVLEPAADRHDKSKSGDPEAGIDAEDAARCKQDCQGRYASSITAVV